MSNAIKKQHRTHFIIHTRFIIQSQDTTVS